jgi:hypothetical protein
MIGRTVGHYRFFERLGGMERWPPAGCTAGVPPASPEERTP